ncbi:hypothetical protein [Dictyobacter aurantiacus]|uniref:Uncharacterized protein n=1 Tax=Dictyobacter aurantiacus TaxID=1936993 RepID=A0A401Z801_9CHLR|nr:hypothetical protein [Dictyobacter aurantiacus]GCE02948.1 hypothetical protein KDAU_02770 [Dictyobacter aurantiacus]
MAFTQDELQSLNTILEQKLATQRHELERTFDLRLQGLRRDFEQRIATVKSDVLSTISQRLIDQHARTREMLVQNFEAQHARLVESVEQSLELQQQEQQRRLEASIERPLAAQLLAIEQIIHQRLPSLIPSTEFFPDDIEEGQAQFDTIEVQTEIPWDELATLVDHALEERISVLQESILTAVKDLQQSLITHMPTAPSTSAQGNASPSANSASGAQPTADATKNIERLEHLIEAMQVAMTANSSLISNRLYHHQQLPLERAHPTQNGVHRPSALHSFHSPRTRSTMSESSGTDE